MPSGSIRPFGLARLLVCASLLAGCSGSSSSSGTSPDAATGADAAPGSDDGGGGEVLRIVPVSPTGHDHFWYHLRPAGQHLRHRTGRAGDRHEHGLRERGREVHAGRRARSLVRRSRVRDPQRRDRHQRRAVPRHRGPSTGKIVVSGSVEHAGAFMLEGAALLFPIKAIIRFQGRTRQMLQAQLSGDCNLCHTVAGGSGAPGRIMLP